MNFEIAPKSTETRLTWNDARLYCFSLNIAEKTGWRLPTKEELNEIYNSDHDFEKYCYWSSTERGGIHVWVQYFGNITNGGYFNKDSNRSYIRAIRDLKAN